MPRAHSGHLRATHRGVSSVPDTPRRIDWAQRMQALDGEQSELRRGGKIPDGMLERAARLSADIPVPVIDKPLEDMPEVLLLMDVVKRSLSDAVDLGRPEQPANTWYGCTAAEVRAELWEWADRPGGPNPFESLEGACDVLSVLTGAYWNFDYLREFIRTKLERQGRVTQGPRRTPRIVPRLPKDAGVESGAARPPGPREKPVRATSTKVSASEILADAQNGSYPPNSLAFIVHDLGELSWTQVATAIGSTSHAAVLRLCRDADGSRPVAIRQSNLHRVARLVRLANLILGWKPGQPLLAMPQEFGLRRVTTAMVEAAEVDRGGESKPWVRMTREAAPFRPSLALRLGRAIEVAKRRGDRARVRELSAARPDDQKALQAWYQETYPYLAEAQPDARKAGLSAVGEAREEDR